MTLSRHIKSTIIVLVAALLLWGGYFVYTNFQQKQVPLTNQINTSTWKTCRNEKAGYELKYPPEWFVYGDGSRDGFPSSIQRETECLGQQVLFSEQQESLPDAKDSENYFLLGVRTDICLPTTDDTSLLFAPCLKKGNDYNNVSNTDELYKNLHERTERFVSKATIVDGNKAFWLGGNSTDSHGVEYQDVNIYHKGKVIEILAPGDALNIAIIEAVLGTLVWLD